MKFKVISILFIVIIFFICPTVYAAEPIINSFENTEIPNDHSSALSLGIFQRIGIIGDSYASGEIWNNNVYNDNYYVSWGQVLARKYGIHCTNYSRGGLSTKTWLTDYMGSPLLNASDADDLYILALGINDYFTYHGDYLGSLADITSYSDSSQYANSFYGNYGKIIEQIKQHAPNSKMVIFSITTNTSFSHPWDGAVKEIAEYYKIPYIDQTTDYFYSFPEYINMSVGHPTELGYSIMASGYDRLLTNSLLVNYQYFYGMY